MRENAEPICRKILKTIFEALINNLDKMLAIWKKHNILRSYLNLDMFTFVLTIELLLGRFFWVRY